LHQAGNPTPENGSNSEQAAVPTEAGQPEESYAAVGEEVAAVLASAHQAAEQIREAALQDAQRLRAEAKNEVAAILSETNREAERKRRESEKVRSDADVYSKEARDVADRHVAEIRMKLDKEATHRRAEVDEQVRGILRGAEQKARNLETQAIQRQKALVEEVGRAETRLEQLLGIFRGMTLQLEDLVSADSARRSEGGVGETKPGAVPLDEALRPRPSPSRSR
jgi:DNA anti-recombination protein RmuC